MFYLKVDNHVFRYNTEKALSLAKYMITFPESILWISKDECKVFNHRTAINVYICKVNGGYTYESLPSRDGASLFRLCNLMKYRV